MQAVSMRHNRLQLRLDGSPLVELPPRTEAYVTVTMDSSSSHAYVNRWVEAAAVKLLQGFSRFDVRVTGLIMMLQQLVTTPTRLLEEASREQMDDVLSKLASFAATNAGHANLEIRQVDLRTAIVERKQDIDSSVLQSSSSWRKMAAAALHRAFIARCHGLNLPTRDVCTHCVSDVVKRCSPPKDSFLVPFVMQRLHLETSMKFLCQPNPHMNLVFSVDQLNLNEPLKWTWTKPGSRRLLLSSNRNLLSWVPPLLRHHTAPFATKETWIFRVFPTHLFSAPLNPSQRFQNQQQSQSVRFRHESHLDILQRQRS